VLAGGDPQTELSLIIEDGDAALFAAIERNERSVQSEFAAQCTQKLIVPGTPKTHTRTPSKMMGNCRLIDPMKHWLMAVNITEIRVHRQKSS
jgi:hypothetical protein